MFGPKKTGASAYATVGLETGVAAASPHKLVTMLFDGALLAIAMAIQHMAAKNYAGKSEAISKAANIVESGLRACLDTKAGGEVAANLDALYRYAFQRILTANLNNDPKILTEVATLLAGLRDAWVSIDPNTVQQPSHATNIPNQRPNTSLTAYSG